MSSAKRDLLGITREFFVPPMVFAGIGALVGLCARVVGSVLPCR